MVSADTPCFRFLQLQRPIELIPTTKKNRWTTTTLSTIDERCMQNPVWLSFLPTNVAPRKKNGCHITPLPPQEGHFFTSDTFLCAKVAVLKRFGRTYKRKSGDDFSTTDITNSKHTKFFLFERELMQTGTLLLGRTATVTINTGMGELVGEDF